MKSIIKHALNIEFILTLNHSWITINWLLLMHLPVLNSWKSETCLVLKLIQSLSKHSSKPKSINNTCISISLFAFLRYICFNTIHCFNISIQFKIKNAKWTHMYVLNTVKLIIGLSHLKYRSCNFNFKVIKISVDDRSRTLPKKLSDNISIDLNNYCSGITLFRDMQWHIIWLFHYTKLQLKWPHCLLALPEFNKNK